MSHPLIRHKLSILRNIGTDTKDFRHMIHEIALLIGYEATRDLKLEGRTIRTPLEEMTGEFLAGSVCLLPILRAGLGMVEALLELIPTARVGHLGLYRDPKTLLPVEYYSNLPPDVENMDVLILDPMLATGGSASAAIAFLKARGVRSIRLLNIIGAPQGVKAVQSAHPDIEIYLGAMDRTLNEKGYILPGLGDAGDRIFGTIE